MSSNATVKEFKEALSKRDDSTSEVLLDFNDVKVKAVSNGVSIISDDGPLEFSDSAFRAMSEQLDIPVPYAHRMPNELLEYSFNYMLNANSNKSVRAFVTETNEGNVIRTMMDANLPYVKTLDLFEAVEDTVPGEYDMKYGVIAPDYVSWSVLPHALQVDELVESKIFSGIQVRFSESWAVNPLFDGLLWREQCANGMTAAIKSKKFRISGKAEGEITNQARVFTNSALELLPDMIEGYTHLAEEKIDKPRKLITSITTQFKIPKKILNILLDTMENPLFLQTIPDGKITDMSDILNLITWVGTHNQVLTQDWLSELQRIAGQIALEHHDYCGNCGTII